MVDMNSRIGRMAQSVCAAALLAALAACGDYGSITPTPALYTVGGMVTGLTGSGLILQNSGISLPVGKSGSFTIGTQLLSGTPYAVGVETQPTNPYQICTTA